MSQLTSEKGICLQGFIPMRKEPSERSEMVSQLLFGEGADIIAEQERWLHVHTQFDGYEGWIDKKSLEPAEAIMPGRFIVAHDTLKLFNLTDSVPVLIPVGAIIPEISNGQFHLGGKTFSISDTGALTEPGQIKPGELFNQLVSIPYIWGGRCGFGFDCSGLTQFLCRIAGKNIPRDASKQSSCGSTLNFMNETREGDLAFFDNAEGVIHHVGMLTGNGLIIHASGMVRIDRIDQQGIFNEKLGRYTYKLRLLKRVI